MSNNIVGRADKVLSPVLGHYTRLEVTSGKGVYLYGADGKAYMDFASGIAVASTGHCHPQVTAAIQKQAETLIHACAGVVYYPQNVELAEQLGALLGHDLTSVFFCQSGTEAIEASLKLAKYVTKKPGILAFTGGFHGRSLGALSITTSKAKYKEGYEPLLPHTHYFPYPYMLHETKSEDQLCQELEAFIDGLPDTVGAAIIEPILGEGGYTPAPTTFLKQLRASCNKKNMLLIFDEIQTGFSRTGAWFDFQTHQVVPDIIALAKGMASGMPLGACVSRPDLMNKWTTGAHGGTYGGNPVSCAASLATINVLKENLPTIAKKSELAKNILVSELSKHPKVADIRIKGLMIGVEFHKAEDIKPIMEACLKHNLIVVSCGIYDNVIRLIPPLTITEQELSQGIRIFTEVVNATH
jgi:4-aminobutyrate aminotransferase